MTIDLKAEFGQVPGYNPTVSAKYGNTGKTGALKNLYLWLNSLGMSDATIGTIDSFSAEHNEAVWRTHGYYPGSGWQAEKPCNSRANIEWPDGVWKIRMPLLGAHGDYYGQNSTTTAAGDSFGYGTRIVKDSTWIGVPGWPKYSFITSGYGTGVGGYYNEGMGLFNVDFEGNGPSNNSGSVLLYNGGSCMEVGRIRTDGDGVGIHVIGAIPLFLRNVRSFRNSRAALLLEGTALGTVSCDRLEADDNGAVIEMIAGIYGQSAGLKSGTFAIKTENGKNTSTPQTTLKLAGQFAMTITDLSEAYYNGVRPEAVVQWDTDNANSSLVVMNYCNAGTSANGGPLYLAKTRTKTYPAPLNSDGFGFSIKAGNLLSGQR